MCPIKSEIWNRFIQHRNSIHACNVLEAFNVDEFHIRLPKDMGQNVTVKYSASDLRGIGFVSRPRDCELKSLGHIISHHTRRIDTEKWHCWKKSHEANVVRN
jgi:hypothetical protein